MPSHTLLTRTNRSGFLLGSILHVANLYVGLKSGNGINISITAAVMSWAVYRALAVVMPKFFSDITVCAFCTDWRVNDTHIYIHLSPACPPDSGEQLHANAVQCWCDGTARVLHPGLLPG